MSATSALQRIEKWAVNNDPEFVASLRPGLTHSAIDESVADLPFQIAEEVYELYLWHDGEEWGDYRLGLCQNSLYRFLPLAEAMAEYESYLADRYRTEAEQSYQFAGQSDGWPATQAAIRDAGGWLPLFVMNNCDYRVSLGTRKESSPIVWVAHDDRPAIFYRSLNAMLQFRADVYEANAIRYDEDDGEWADYTITSEIVRRHFPEKAVRAEADYDALYGSSRELQRDGYSNEEWQDFGVIVKLVQSGSIGAVPAVLNYLRCLLGNKEQAELVTQELVRAPFSVMRDWPHARSLIVHNLTYAFLLQ